MTQIQTFLETSNIQYWHASKKLQKLKITDYLEGFVLGVGIDKQVKPKNKTNNNPNSDTNDSQENAKKPHWWSISETEHVNKKTECVDS